MGWNKPNQEARWPVVAVRLPSAERSALHRMARAWECSQSYIIRYGIALAAREMGITMHEPLPSVIDDVNPDQVMFEFPVSDALAGAEEDTA